jgi:hypothetical protein
MTLKPFRLIPGLEYTAVIYIKMFKFAALTINQPLQILSKVPHPKAALLW